MEQKEQLHYIFLVILLTIPVWNILIYATSSSHVDLMGLFQLLIIPFNPAMIYLFVVAVMYPISLLFGGIVGLLSGFLSGRLFQRTWLIILMAYWGFAHGCNLVLNIGVTYYGWIIP